MKNTLYEVSYKETPTSEIITRKIYYYSNTSIDTMTNVLKYEESMSKNQLVVISLKNLT